MKPMTTGEKIKFFRKHYKIKQVDIYKGLMSQSMFSFIEKDKYLLKEEIANIFVERINNFIKKIENKITVDYLIKSKEEEIKDFFHTNFLRKIKNKDISKEEMDEVIFYIKQLKNDKEKILLFLAIINYNMKEKNTFEISFLIDEAINKALTYELYKYIPVLILQSQRFNSIENNFEKTLRLFYKNELILNTISEDRKEIFGLIFFNFALAFQRENRIENAIELYKKSFIFFRKEVRAFSCLNNLGICYSNTNEFKKALEIFLKSKKYINNEIQKAINYSNLLLCYLELNEETAVKIVKEKLENVIEKIPTTQKYQSYYCLGKAYLFQNDRYNAMINFEKELVLPFDITFSQFYVKKYNECIILLMQIYNEKDIEKFKRLEKSILRIPTKYLNTSFLIEVAKKYLLVYNKKEYLSFLNKISGSK